MVRRSCRQRRDGLVQEYLSLAPIMTVGGELSSELLSELRSDLCDELYEYLTKR